MNIRTGDYISIYYDEDHSDNTRFTGLVISAKEDPSAAHRKDNFSRWWNVKILFGCEVKEVSVYWDDRVEVHARNVQ